MRHTSLREHLLGLEPIIPRLECVAVPALPCPGVIVRDLLKSFHSLQMVRDRGELCGWVGMQPEFLVHPAARPNGGVLDRGSERGSVSLHSALDDLSGRRQASFDQGLAGGSRALSPLCQGPTGAARRLTRTADRGLLRE